MLLRCHNRIAGGLSLLAALFLGLQRAALAPKLGAGSVSGVAGAVVQLPIQYTGGTNGAVALQFDVVYDSSKMTSQDAVAGPVLTKHLVSSDESVSGTRRVVIYSLQNALAPDGVIASVPFAIPLGAPSGSVNVVLTNAIIANLAGDNAGAVALTNGVVEIGSALPPHLDSVSRLANGSVQFNVTAGPGLYFIDGSRDLRTWTPIGTNQFSGGTFTFTDTTAPVFNYRFYRARLGQ